MKVLPLYNVLVLPHSDIFFQTQTFRAIAGNNVYQGDEIRILILKEQQTRSEITAESFYPIGVIGTIEEISTEGYVVIRTGDRVDVQEITVNENHEILAETTKRIDIIDMDAAEAEERLAHLKDGLREMATRFRFGDMMRTYIDQYSSIEEAASVLSAWLTLSNEERYALLSEDSMRKRFDELEKIIYEYTEVAKVTSDAQIAQQEDNQKAYREQALRKQLEYIQHELDELHPEQVSDARRFELRLQELPMNEDAKREATKVLNRYKNDGSNSAESGMLYDYLDFVTGLSWQKEPAADIDLAEAQRILDEDHFGMKKVKERIIQQIAIMRLRKKQSGSILLFVGAPGTGKTSIGRSIARALHRKYVRVSLGGVRDEADIRGHRRTYIGAMPGRIMDGISKAGVSNPVMVLDEIDKLSSSFNGDPASALLEVLDPEQNSTFTDHYMNVPYDLSDVFFICTANTVDSIPAPLLNRMEVIEFQGYTPTEKLEIAKRHLFPKALSSVGLPQGSVEIEDDAIDGIISDYTREGGVRGLKKRLDTLCRIAAVQYLKAAEETKPTDAAAPASEEANADTAASSGSGGTVPVIHVARTELRSFLDMHALPHNKVKEAAQPGVVTGLAWTQVGGEILYIETLFTKGSGKTILTGQLGDVMKESGAIAESLVKARFPEKAECFEKNNLHIHVPDGSTPKDGPSAGITMTTAIASLVTGIPVPPQVAMTGEVSLEGAVNAIGGLPEKLMAAERAGVRKVFIPKENVEDLRDVAEEVREKLEIVPVESVEEVLTALGLLQKRDSKEEG